MLLRADEDNDDLLLLKATRYIIFLVFFQVSSIIISKNVFIGLKNSF